MQNPGGTAAIFTNTRPPDFFFAAIIVGIASWEQANADCMSKKEGNKERI
jgi:hypothetical protein